MRGVPADATAARSSSVARPTSQMPAVKTPDRTGLENEEKNAATAATTSTSIQVRRSALTVAAVKATSCTQNRAAIMTVETATRRVRLAAMPA